LVRRAFLSAAAASGLAIAADARITFGQIVAPEATVPDLILTNGRIHTMDARNAIVESVAIRRGRFQVVGGRLPARGNGTRVINLRGRTVIAGIIDAHNHFVNEVAGYEKVHAEFPIADVRWVIAHVPAATRLSSIA
jgi:imidazolonepropionase-like amidohydrolase